MVARSKPILNYLMKVIINQRVVFLKFAVSEELDLVSHQFSL